MSGIPDFHPKTVLIDWKDKDGRGFTIGDALAGCCVMGGTGSGKTSGPGTLLALSYLKAGFGGLVLCAKKDERRHIEELARIAGREDDLIIFDASGRERFNFLDWEAERTGGPGLTINVVHLLDQIAEVMARGSGAGGDGGGGENRFFSDALHHLNMNLVDLPLFAGLPVSLPLLRAILNSAPQTAEEAADPAWRNAATPCPTILREAEAAVAQGDPDAAQDFKECKAYWTQEFPGVSSRSRSIFTLMFSMLVRPFITRPLRRLFAEDTTVTPERAFAGKVIVIDLPLSEYRLAGQVAALCWKHCFQMAVLRRVPPKRPDEYLRPVFLWADEAQYFLTGEHDTAYQAVARSAGGCSVYLFQNREILISSLRREATVDALLGNLQTKFFCQNSSPQTNKWAAELLGERFVSVSSTTVGRSEGARAGLSGDAESNRSAGLSRSEQRRFYTEPARFTTLKRGGSEHGFTVEAIVYNGGKLFTSDAGEPVPFKSITIRQR
jgi:hypothetical protein